MKNKDLILYGKLQDKIEEQALVLFAIAEEEFPEQFGNFIIDSKPSVNEVEIRKNKTICIIFKETSGGYGDTHSINLHFDIFLNKERFREIQKKAKNGFLKEQREQELLQEQKRREQYEALKKEFD